MRDIISAPGRLAKAYPGTCSDPIVAYRGQAMTDYTVLASLRISTIESPLKFFWRFEMSNLIPFQFENHEIRVVTVSGEPWVVATDVAKAIGHSDARKLVDIADEDDRKKVPVIDSLGRKQETWVVNEPGLYQLLLGSNVEKAKTFRRWVTAEVLPSIRKTGRYETGRTEPRALATDTILQLPACIDAIKSIFPNLGEASLQQIAGDICESDLGRRLIPLPVIVEKFYTATDLAEELGVSAQKVGRIATAFGLKTEEFGEYRLSKSKYSAKQVEQFHYNEKGRQALALLFSETAEIN